MRWVVVAALVVSCGLGLADDVELDAIRNDLDAAVETYFKEIEEIDQDIGERFDRLIERAANQGKLEEVQRLQQDKEIYARIGAIPNDDTHLISRNRINAGVKRATSRLAATYEEAIEVLTKARKFTDAQRIKTEFDELRRELRTAESDDAVPAAVKKARSLKSPQVLGKTIRNSIGLMLKFIPAGTFTMGEGRTAHQVTLTQPFYLGVTEVTNAQWKAVMGNVPSQWKDDDRPVEQVSWDDAVSFCKKLSSLPAERAAGRVYRLPTEAEWEFSCRAGTSTGYSFGDDESLLGDFAWFKKNADGQTHAVGQKRPNAWGLYDMHGNVSEWCSDWLGDYPSGPVSDPRGPLSGSARVFKGGRWSVSDWVCRSALRGAGGPPYRGKDVGFRLALSPSGSKLPEAGQ